MRHDFRILPRQERYSRRDTNQSRSYGHPVSRGYPDDDHSSARTPQQEILALEDTNTPPIVRAPTPPARKKSPAHARQTTVIALELDVTDAHTGPGHVRAHAREHPRTTPTDTAASRLSGKAVADSKGYHLTPSEEQYPSPGRKARKLPKLRLATLLDRRISSTPILRTITHTDFATIPNQPSSPRVS